MILPNSLYGLSRRAVVGGALALAGCQRPASSQVAPVHVPPLKSLASFPVGTAVQAVHLQDPVLSGLIAAQASQLTPEWEMKMEYIVRDDGGFRFDAPDAIAAFARVNGLRLFGHTLIWYAQSPPAFEALDESRVSFAEAYRNYIHAVVGRYRGQAVGWDVVNEAVAEDGEGWRDSLWSRRLGPFDHMVLAFQHAREADPAARLFLNDYNLEWLPKKRATFLRLAERLMAAGAPIDGVGTQTHIAADQDPGELRRTIAELGQLGLLVHVSEFDVSLSRAEGVFKDWRRLAEGQAALYAQAAEAFMALPASQRFAFTFWGLRDAESWLKREDGADTPLPFDEFGQPKAAAAAWAERVA
ncbi:endo-1,4-beta-xylanase [Phenylobacterium sp.]|uniref:endo-1,4-beta-xylanase n=1 Tax=Phenylobacterium sp. TaxID=1871053 RepID=UPI003447409D